MESTKYLLIGAGLGCHSAAKGIRELDSSGAVLLVGQEPYAPYDHPPLSKDFMRGKTPKEKVFLSDDVFYREQAIDLLTGVAVESLDPSAHQAKLSDGRTVRWEKALLATGGRPIRPRLPGAELPGIYCFRTLDDALAVSEEATPGRRAVLVGGGFIGMELAASLTLRGVQVTLVELGEQVWPRFADRELADHVRDYCAGKGVAFRLGEKVAGFAGDGRALRVELAGGAALECDFACLAVGIAPNVEIAQRAGLKADNGVVVDERMRTSHPDVYAAGDIANYPDPHFGVRRRVEHWGQAEYTGALAGENMAGGARAYDLLTYVWTEVFDLHLEFEGIEGACDRKLLRGRMEDGAFCLMHLKDGRLTAYYAVKTPKAVRKSLGNLIRAKTDLTGKETQLQDPTFDPAALL